MALRRSRTESPPLRHSLGIAAGIQWFSVEPVVRQFDSYAEAEAADRAYYRSLTPEQRLEILFDLVARYREEHGCSERLERVYRIVELSRS